MSVIVTPNYDWSNEHNNVHQHVLRRYQISNAGGAGWREGLAGIQQMIAETRARSERLRSYGGKWSLSDVAVCNDAIHDSKPLTYWASIPDHMVSGTAWFDDAKPLHDRLFFFQAGAQITQINRALERRDLALPTSGASNGQTLAGAVSTGTHGSAMRVGAMQDYVRAIHLVTSATEHILLQPASAPAVNQAMADVFGARLVNDDDLFYAAVVSFGAFGVIHGMVIETVSLFNFIVHNQFVDRSVALTSLDLLAVFDQNSTSNLRPFLTSVGLPDSEDPYHFEIVFNQFKEEEGAFLRVMYKRDHDAVALDPVPPGSGNRVGDDVVSAIGGLANIIGPSVPLIVSTFFGEVGDVVAGYRQTPQNIFSDSTLFKPSQGTASAELGVPIQQAREAITLTNDACEAHHFPGVVACRFVKATRATLGFTRFAPLTCTIELPGLDTDNTMDAYSAVFAALDAAGIPFTLHWGQEGDYSPARLNSMYGSAVDSWKGARARVLPDPMQRYMFTNDFMKRIGISEPPALDGGGVIA